jgi:hypothetical protein
MMSANHVTGRKKKSVPSALLLPTTRITTSWISTPAPFVVRDQLEPVRKTPESIVHHRIQALFLVLFFLFPKRFCDSPLVVNKARPNAARVNQRDVNRGRFLFPICLYNSFFYRKLDRLIRSQLEPSSHRKWISPQLLTNCKTALIGPSSPTELPLDKRIVADRAKADVTTGKFQFKLRFTEGIWQVNENLGKAVIASKLDLVMTGLP